MEHATLIIVLIDRPGLTLRKKIVTRGTNPSKLACRCTFDLSIMLMAASLFSRCLASASCSELRNGRRGSPSQILPERFLAALLSSGFFPRSAGMLTVWRGS